MKRRRGEPAREPAPFIDQWGKPAYTNPLGRYRPNPALDSAAPVEPIAAISLSEPPTTNQVRIQGWETRERHFAVAQPVVHEAPPAGEAPVTEPLVSEAPVSEALVSEALVSRADARPDATLGAPVASDAVDAPTEGTRAERLARQLEQRSARRRRRARRTVVVVVAVSSALIGVGAASAYFSPDGSNGDTADAATASVTAFATAGNRSSPLLAGGTGDVMMQVNNPNSYAVTLKGVAGGPFPSAVTGGPGCKVSNSSVKFVTPGALNVHLPANTISTVQLVDAATRGLSSARECDGQTFTIPVSLTVRKA